jgi:4,5-DOPA dioxygenase extradiol
MAVKPSKKIFIFPALFVGHGSPLNAIENNAFTRSLKRLGWRLPRPKAILAVSAHWETAGTKVFVDSKPKTIHDFRGFPKVLSEFSYDAPGAPRIARRVVEMLSSVGAVATTDWGLDHGTWSVLKHMYPKADVPVFQLSLDRGLLFDEHYRIGTMLSPLREKGVMILGLGNIVHNLDAYDPKPAAKPFDWAVEFDRKIKHFLLKRDVYGLIDLDQMDPDLVRRAMPTEEHYLPLLYVVGVSRKTDKLSFPYQGFQNASMSMRSVLFT